MVMMTRDRVFAIRDPRGFRPLSMGRIPGGGPVGDTVVFASETCAFDLIGAVYERDVKPGEMVVVGPEGVFSRYFASEMKQSACIFEHVYFSRPDSVLRKHGNGQSASSPRSQRCRATCAGANGRGSGRRARC